MWGRGGFFFFLILQDISFECVGKGCKKKKIIIKVTAQERHGRGLFLYSWAPLRSDVCECVEEVWDRLCL